MNILCLSLVLMQVQLSTVNGTVTKPGGNEALPKATVFLTPVNPAPVNPGPAARIPSTVTEDDGRFTLRDIAPGDYRLAVQSDRYGSITYGQRKPGGPGAILSLAAGQQVTNLRLSMIPTGTIAGRITGRAGDPIVYALVQAYKYVYENGRKALSVAQSTTTDDRGEYRLFWLPAGQYYVAAATGSTAAQPGPAVPMRPGMSNYLTNEVLRLTAEFMLVENELRPLGSSRLRVLEDGTTQEESWPPVYFPATTEARLATALDVAAGTTRSGIDIVIGPARIQSIRGRVVGFTSGTAANGAQIIPTVTLVPQETGGLRVQMVSRGASNIDGSFVFTGVFPGDYVVAARDRLGSPMGPPVEVHVGDGDVENLSLSVGQAISLSGRIRVEDSTTAAPNVSVIFQPTIGPAALLTLRNTPVDPGTGSFVVNNLSPGDYQIQISSGGGPSAKPLFVKSVRLGLTDVSDGIRITLNTADAIEIVLTADPGSVEGVAIGARAVPAPSTTVVLVPSARKRFELYKSIVTGADGRFRFEGIAPGDYKLFAWDDVETGAWQDPEFLRNHESKGLLVHLAGKSKEDVQLNVIYNP